LAPHWPTHKSRTTGRLSLASPGRVRTSPSDGTSPLTASLGCIVIVSPISAREPNPAQSSRGVPVVPLNGPTKPCYRTLAAFLVDPAASAPQDFANHLADPHESTRAPGQSSRSAKRSIASLFIRRSAGASGSPRSDPTPGEALHSERSCHIPESQRR
jgi:hypothetical protein